MKRSQESCQFEKRALLYVIISFLYFFVYFLKNITKIIDTSDSLNDYTPSTPLILDITNPDSLPDIDVHFWGWPHRLTFEKGRYETRYPMHEFRTMKLNGDSGVGPWAWMKREQSLGDVWLYPSGFLNTSFAGNGTWDISPLWTRPIFPEYNGDLKKIPKIIWQTTADKSKLPKKFWENKRKYAKDYDVRVWEDAQLEDFMETHWPGLVPRFRTTGFPHKADIWRYAALYYYGGVYLDIETELIRPIDEIFDQDSTLYSQRFSSWISQGIIATPPRNPFFLDLLDYCHFTRPIWYQEYTSNFMQSIRKWCNHDIHKFDGFCENKIGDVDFMIFREVCTRNKSHCPDGLDSRGKCCYMERESGERLMKMRFTDYPWNGFESGQYF